MDGMFSKKISGFSLVEAVVAAVIFSITVVGVFASLAAIQQPAANSGQSLNAALCGQQVLENLRSKVDARDWDTGGALATGSHTPLTPSQCSSFTFTYDVTAPVAVNGARKVDLTVTW